jgi:hypothetical protein
MNKSSQTPPLQAPLNAESWKQGEKTVLLALLDHPARILNFLNHKTKKPSYNYLCSGLPPSQKIEPKVSGDEAKRRENSKYHHPSRSIITLRKPSTNTKENRHREEQVH